MYNNDLRIGKEKCYGDTGKVIGTQYWVNGILNGTQTWYHDSGEVKSLVNYIDGKRQGESTSYWKNGNIHIKGTFVDDKQHGEQFFYRGVSKTIFAINNYNMDVPDGAQKSFYKSGQINAINNYSNGFPEQGELYYESGGIRLKRNYVEFNTNDIDKNVLDLWLSSSGLKIKELNRQEIFYYESGAIKSIGNIITDPYFIESKYKKGKGLQMSNENNNGTVILFYETGQVFSEVDHLNGLKNGKKSYYFKNGDIDYDELYLDDEKSRQKNSS